MLQGQGLLSSTALARPTESWLFPDRWFRPCPHLGSLYPATYSSSINSNFPYHYLLRGLFNDTMSKPDLSSLASFKSFPFLPVEIQILIWKLAFADSDFLALWVARLEPRSLYSIMQGLDTKIICFPAFWYWSSDKMARPGHPIIRGGRKAGLPVQVGINRMLHACRLARRSCLEVFRGALRDIDDCSTEIKVIEGYIAAMKVVEKSENGMAACIPGLSALPCTPKTSTRA